MLAHLGPGLVVQPPRLLEHREVDLAHAHVVHAGHVGEGLEVLLGEAQLPAHGHGASRHGAAVQLEAAPPRVLDDGGEGLGGLLQPALQTRRVFACGLEFGLHVCLPGL